VYVCNGEHKCVKLRPLRVKFQYLFILDIYCFCLCVNNLIFIDDFYNLFPLYSKTLVHLTVCRYQILMCVYEKSFLILSSTDSNVLQIYVYIFLFYVLLLKGKFWES